MTTQIIDHETGLVVSGDHALVPLSEVETFLATRPPVETAKELRDRLAALCTYYKGKVDVYNELYEGQLRTERYIGQVLAELPKNVGTRLGGNIVLPPDETPTLNDLGFTAMQSSRLQQLADVPEERFNSYIATKKSATERIVKADLLNQDDLADAFERQIQEAEYVAPRDEQRRQQIAVITGSSESNEWYTPAHIIEAARQVLGHIDLDPASSEAANRVVRAGHIYTITDDGYAQIWHGRVWLNPPYGRADGETGTNAVRWSRKLIAEYEAGRVESAILLVKAALGYNWFEDLWRLYPTCLLRERLSFVRSDGNDDGQSKHATALLYLGREVVQFQTAFRRLGRVVMPDEEPAL